MDSQARGETHVAPAEFELELNPADLYPPLLGSSGSVSFITNVSPDQPLVFDFTVNGESGEVPGISMISGDAGGVLTFSREFIEHYAGAWPQGR